MIEFRVDRLGAAGWAGCESYRKLGRAIREAERVLRTAAGTRAVRVAADRGDGLGERTEWLDTWLDPKPEVPA